MIIGNCTAAETALSSRPVSEPKVLTCNIYGNMIGPFISGKIGGWRNACRDRFVHIESRHLIVGTVFHRYHHLILNYFMTASTSDAKLISTAQNYVPVKNRRRRTCCFLPTKCFTKMFWFHQSFLVFLVSDRTDRRTDRQTDAISMFWAFLVLKN